MNAEKFIKWFLIGMKILVPVSFFVIASFPKSYWLAGIMTVLMVFQYGIEYFVKK